MRSSNKKISHFMSKFDINQDGKVSRRDIEEAGEILEIELREEKADTQRRMAWAAMISMVAFTIVLFSPLVTDERVKSLADLLGLFYIAQAGVVGAYMSVTAWMSKSPGGRATYNSFTPRSTPPDDEPVNGR